MVSDFARAFDTEENGASRVQEVANPPQFNVERDEGFRADRLKLTWGHACATVQLMSNLYQQRWSGAVVALEDQKGTLHVTWRDRDSRLAFEGAIIGAWEANGEHANSHHLVG
ncbi:hypothetical protein ACYZX9_03680 [Sphingomonas citri]